MAKKSFTERVPAFKWIFLFALVVSVPLTLWSLSSAPTETRSSAATYTCGPNGVNPSCPTHYYCSYIQGNPTFGGNCTYLPATTNLHTDARKCVVSGTEYDFLNFNWNTVSSALSYRVYYRIYGSGSSYNYKDTTQDFLTVTSYKNLNGRHIQWYVRDYHGSTYNTSAVYTTGNPTSDCSWMMTP